MTGFIATRYYSWCVKFLMPIKTSAIFRDGARDELQKSSGWLRPAASVISALNVITAKEDARLFLSEIFRQLSNSYHCVSSFRRLNAYAVLITAWKSLSKNITILITTDTTDHSLFLLLTGKTQYLGGGGKGVRGREGIGDCVMSSVQTRPKENGYCFGTKNWFYKTRFFCDLVG